MRFCDQLHLSITNPIWDQTLLHGFNSLLCSKSSWPDDCAPILLAYHRNNYFEEFPILVALLLMRLTPFSKLRESPETTEHTMTHGVVRQ